ncbi:MAG TPA: helix-turn-helix transcriptional regulator [Terriglobales bacterium]|jgi:transcriptional regulator with XRE-family HTH domain
MPPGAANGTLNLGVRIRQARLQRGLSQGDLEQRTGLLRCYLSRVENGHTEPSLPTLARLASAMEMPLVAFFDEPQGSAAGLSPEELAFLTQMRQLAVSLSEHHRQQVLQLAEKMAAETTAPPARAAAAGD